MGVIVYRKKHNQELIVQLKNLKEDKQCNQYEFQYLKEKLTGT